MKKLLTTVMTPMIFFCINVLANESEHNSKSINFDQILAPAYKKVKFKINTTANKDNVHLEFEAMKLSGGQYAVYKINNCD
jgi:DNA gyrase inhibitor GyrI